MNNIGTEETRQILELAPLAMLLLDCSGTVRDCNRAFAALTGMPIETVCNSRCEDGLLTGLLAEGSLINWIMPDGDERWLAVEILEIGYPVSGTLRCYHDITEKLRLRQERDELAREIRDGSLRDEQLTSLLSRHGLHTSLEPLVARSRRYNTPISVVALHVDCQPSHALDQALVGVAQVLKDQTRWADLIGCNAQHDFLIVLQETTQDSALQLVEKLQERLQGFGNENCPEVRTSFGVTECRRNDDAASLLERAEAALEEACNSENGISIAL